MAKATADARELINKLPDNVTTSGITEEQFFKRGLS